MAGRSCGSLSPRLKDSRPFFRQLFPPRVFVPRSLFVDLKPHSPPSRNNRRIILRLTPFLYRPPIAFPHRLFQRVLSQDGPSVSSSMRTLINPTLSQDFILPQRVPHLGVLPFTKGNFFPLPVMLWHSSSALPVNETCPSISWFLEGVSRLNFLFSNTLPFVDKFPPIFFYFIELKKDLLSILQTNPDPLSFFLWEGYSLSFVCPIGTPFFLFSSLRKPFFATRRSI